ncbi:hypothetical protein [Rickettsiella endosymbiont of Dermanyssus gallinae]|uniref:hypothetical protein n=1 Tax=Rickettsiella endosymbiont of Dermanyssus gallinae TaxID=2856608 RepID=UPI001C52C32C|nr:hypothetical protein [Rickettsiella endosymbiont of Dermanyssus gallinae]
MENNTHFASEQASFLPELLGIEMVSGGDKAEMVINRDSLSAHCQYALVEATVNTFNVLEEVGCCEEQQEALEQAFRTYITTTKKPIDFDSVWKRLLVASFSTLVCFMVGWAGMRYAIRTGSEPAVVGNIIAAGLIAAGAGLLTVRGLVGLTLCLGNRGMNTAKSEKRLKDLLQEIKPMLEQEVEYEVQASLAANDDKHAVSSEDYSESSSGSFFSATKPKVKENETVPQTLSSSAP